MGPSKTRPARQSGDVGLSALLHQILPVGHHQNLDVDVETMDVDAYDKNTTLMVFAQLTSALAPQIWLSGWSCWWGRRRSWP